MHSLLVSALALASPVIASATYSLPARTAAGIDPSAHPEVVQVQCLTSGGTAFYIGPRKLLTAVHVFNRNGPCRVGGKPFEVIEQKGDFAILTVADPVKKWLAVDCGGYKAGKTYTAIGYARGLKTLTSIDAEAKGEKLNGYDRLWGVFHAIPGQSGGPFVSRMGKAVGVVNVFNPFKGDSGSIPLSETSVCKDKPIA